MSSRRTITRGRRNRASKFPVVEEPQFDQKRYEPQGSKIRKSKNSPAGPSHGSKIRKSKNSPAGPSHGTKPEEQNLSASPPHKGFSDSMACMQKLVPCQPYFKAPERVPATCCTPMKKLLSESSDDNNCVCSIFNNPEELKNLNITRDEALKLPKACGTNADISACNNKGATPSPTKSPPTPSLPSNAASHFGKSGFAVIFIVPIFSAAF